MRNYTKYSVEGLGESLNKRYLVFTIVKDWIEKNNPSFEDLQKAFPDEIQGSKGFIRKEKEVVDTKRFNMREPLKIKNGAHVVVSNQWGENILGFIEVAKKLGYAITANSRNEVNSDISSDLEDVIKLNYFKPEIPFPMGTGVIKISVDNSNEKMWQDLGERITIHYDVINNAILKHNNNEDEPTYEYLDVWEAEIPESYLEFEQWLGVIYFSGQIDGKDWNISYHGGHIEDRLNINQDLEEILLKNFSERNMFQFIDEILNLI